MGNKIYQTVCKFIASWLKIYVGLEDAQKELLYMSLENMSDDNCRSYTLRCLSELSSKIPEFTGGTNSDDRFAWWDETLKDEQNITLLRDEIWRVCVNEES